MVFAKPSHCCVPLECNPKDQQHNRPIKYSIYPKSVIRFGYTHCIHFKQQIINRLKCKFSNIGQLKICIVHLKKEGLPMVRQALNWYKEKSQKRKLCSIVLVYFERNCTIESTFFIKNCTIQLTKYKKIREKCRFDCAFFL